MKEKEIEMIEETIETEAKQEIQNEIIEEVKEESTLEQTQEKVEEKPEVTVLEESEDKEPEKETSNKTKNVDGLYRYTKVIAIVSAILLIAAMVFSVIFALINKSNDKIVKGVSIKGIDVSNLTREQATEQLNEVLKKQLKKDITLKHADFETVVTPEQIEMNFKLQETVDLAYSIGRTGNILKDNYAILNANLSKIEINPAYSYNDELLTNFITSTEGNLPDVVKQSSYAIEGSNLIIDKGQKGVNIDKESLKKQIIEVCNSFKEDVATIEIPVIEQQPNVIDLTKIRSEIYKEAKDAYYTKDPFTVYPHVDGVDFAVSLEEAQNLLNNSNENTITIPLKITKPKITINQIGTEAFPNLLATYSTTFSASNTNRTTNIRLASNKINGVVLMPGETFSYNKVVGKRTAAAGYKSAAVYVAGRVENGIGGGICQVSSTLYNTALRANLEIIKRSNHRFATGYVPLSTDATVSWGGPEFVFKNSRKYPVKIVSHVNGGRITVSIYGCKEEVEYDVVIQSQTLQTIPMKTVYRTNTSLPKGTKKTVQKGHGGYKSRAYRILKLNGTVVSKQLLSTDTYAQLETIIEQNP